MTQQLHVKTIPSSLALSVGYLLKERSGLKMPLQKKLRAINSHILSADTLHSPMFLVLKEVKTQNFSRISKIETIRTYYIKIIKSKLYFIEKNQTRP